MHSAVFESFGNPAEVLRIEDTSIPDPGPGQVRVKTILSVIQNHDLMTIAGQYGFKPALPAIGGSEAVGTIDALGEGVEAVAVGQRVSVAGVHGAWAEYFIAESHAVVPISEKIPDVSAAQLLGMPLSALLLLRLIAAQPGHAIIQNAATGAVAKAFAMIAASKGITVINLVRRQEAVVELANIGIRNSVATDQRDWQLAVREMANGAPIMAATDFVGGAASGDILSLVAENGVLISFGALSGKPMEISPGDLIFKQAIVKGFWLSKLLQTTAPNEIGAIVGELVELVENEVIRFQVDAIFDLADISKAMQASVASSRRGKVLLRL
jgi:NADPH2:quinone reductase